MKVLSIAIVAFCAGRLTRRVGSSIPDGPRLALFTFTVCASIVANSIICGALAGPYERYQARVIWLVPFTALVVLVAQPSPISAISDWFSRRRVHDVVNGTGQAGARQGDNVIRMR